MFTSPSSDLGYFWRYITTESNGMPITEAEVMESIPKNGFFAKYMRYAMRVTDAPLAYHIGGGLIILAATAPTEYSFPFGHPLYTNLFSMLVGASRKARKSTAVKTPRRILQEAIPSSTSEAPGSREGLIESIRGNPKQSIFYEEFGEFLAASKDGYMSSMKMLFNTLFDASPIGRALAKSKQGEIKNPRVNVFAGVTPDYLEAFTVPNDWTGGFFARFLVFNAARERTFSVPITDENAFQDLVLEVKERSAILKLGKCRGFDDAAKLVWDNYCSRVEDFKTSKLATGAITGSNTITLKMAMLFALDYGQARSGNDWYITPKELGPALAIAQLHVKSVLEIIDVLSISKDMRDRRTIIGLLSQTEPKTFADLLSSQQIMLKKRLEEILGSLRAEKALQDVVTPTGEAAYLRVVDEFGRKPGASLIDSIESLRIIDRDGNLLPGTTLKPITAPATALDGWQDERSQQERMMGINRNNNNNTIKQKETTQDSVIGVEWSDTPEEIEEIEKVKEVPVLDF
jgi:hypothetical protein